MGREQAEALRDLIGEFSNGEIGAQQFRDELSLFAQTAGGSTATRLREFGEAAIGARVNIDELRQSMDDLTTGLDPERLETQRQRLVKLKEDLAIANLPAGQRDLAEATRRLGIPFDETARGVPQEIQDKLIEEARLIKAIQDRKDAERDAKAADQERETGIDALTKKIQTLRAEVESAEAGPKTPLGEEIKDLAEIAQILNVPTADFDAQSDAVKKLIDLYIEYSAALREHKVIQEGLKEAEDARLKQLDREHDALAKSFDDANKKAERDAEQVREREEGRLEAGGRLPDQIDAANIAARELSATLVDINNLSFESLAAAFGDITQQIIQAIIQALIFRAITGAIGGAGGAAGASAGGAAVAGAHGLVISQGRILRMARGGFITDRPMLMPMASGAALIGEAGPEAVLPLKRMASGDLGVATDGNYGRGSGSTINIDARQSQPGTVATAVNLASRIAPGAVVNAQARGMTRSNRPPF